MIANRLAVTRSAFRFPVTSTESLTSGMVLIGVDTALQDIVLGMVLVAAIIIGKLPNEVSDRSWPN